MENNKIGPTHYNRYQENSKQVKDLKAHKYEKKKNEFLHYLKMHKAFLINVQNKEGKISINLNT